MKYKTVREELKKRCSNIKYFNRATYNIIVRDREKAAAYFERFGECQTFFAGSETLKTDFYTKNGGAYCELLCILN